jgi:hypothetical protein
MKTPVTSILHRGGHALLGLIAVFSLIGLLVVSTPAGASRASSATHGTVSAAVPGASAKKCKRAKARKCKKKQGTGALRPKKRVKAKKPPSRVVVGLPASVDLTAWRVPTGHQGNIGACVAWAINYAMLGWYSRHDGRAGQPFHPMYAYSQVKQPGGGSWPADALNVAKTQGNDTVAHYHGGWNSITDDQTRPNASERTNAANYKIAGFRALFSYPDLRGGGTAGNAQIQTELAAGRPVAIEMRLRPGFYVYNKTNVAAATDSDSTGAYKGLHEVLALGYDQTGLVVQNSWGTGYGYQGLARISWTVVAKDVVAAHTISGFVNDGNVNPPPPPPPPPPAPGPTMGAVTQQFALDNTISDTTAPVTVRWSASSPQGIAAYEVYVKTDSGDFHLQNIPSNATQYTWALASGHSYQAKVRARDTAGTWSAFAYSRTIAPSFTDDTAFNVGSPWARYSNFTGTFGGTYIASQQAGSSATLSFNGTDAALIPAKFPTAGRATIYCDGSATATGDFYADTLVVRRVGAFCHFAQSGQHTMMVVAEGTSGRPWLAVDAFVSL